MVDQLERYHWFIVALLALPLLGGIFLLARDRLSEPAELQISSGEAVPADIRVYISGAVRNPGVYPLKDGDRWIDALEVAGGPAESADLNAVNLSKRVQDGQTPLVNINTADEAALQALPGIGEVRARSIVQSRTTQGPFASVEDLLTRKVVPQSVFTDIEPLITVQ